jgi:hypothetical protein
MILGQIIVIASEAKQSISLQSHGLLRRPFGLLAKTVLDRTKPITL